MEKALPSEWSEWDAVGQHGDLPHPSQLSGAGPNVTAPYDVFALALTSYRAPTKLWTVVADDRAPDAGAIGVAAPAGDQSTAATWWPVPVEAAARPRPACWT